MDVENIVKSLHWLGHDGFRLDSDFGAVYFDPFNIKPDQPKAALMLLSHDHYDHYSPEDVAKVITAQTIVCAPFSVARQMDHANIQVMSPGASFSPWPGVEVKAVHSYNTNKAFHPKVSGWLGFVLTIAGVSIYHAGDSDFIPEMNNISADIALLPVSGTYVMTAREAVQAALAIKPKLAIPMHFGAIVGQAGDAQQFAQALEGKIAVKILAQE